MLQIPIEMAVKDYNVTTPHQGRLLPFLALFLHLSGEYSLPEKSGYYKELVLNKN